MRTKPLFVATLLVMSLLFLTGSSTVKAASPSLLISEVAYDGVGAETDSEFIELFNPTASAIDLTGWQVADNFAIFDLTGSIAAGAFYVIANNQVGFETTYGVSADLYGNTLAFSNSGDELTLYDDLGSVVDYVAWENFTPGWSLMAQTGDSIHRTSTTDTDTEADFVVEPTNPTLSNYLIASTGIDHLLINEVLYDTPGTDSIEEWVEIYNPTSSSVDLSTYTITDGEAIFTLSGSIAAGDFVIVAADSAGFNALYGFNPDISGMTLALSNSGDSVTLADNGVNVDAVGWEGEGGSLVATTGEVLARAVNVDTDSDADWTATTSATPGLQNDGTGANPTPDTEAPIVSINNPTNGATVYRSISITTSSSDNVGVDSQEITIDGNIVSTSSSYYWDTTTVVDGVHTISTQVWDAAGNSASDSISVTVDNANAPPAPAIGEIKIMSYNIEASGANVDWKQVIKEENADIVILIETGDWDNDGTNSVLQSHCDEFNTYFAGQGEDPYTCAQTTGVPYSTSGEAIMSRFPITSTNQIALLTLDDGTTYDPSHDFLDATIDIGGTPTHFIASHLKCCGGATNENKRTSQQEGIINYMDTLGDVPIIYAGDLNSFSPEDTGNLGDLMYQPMSMMLEDTTYYDLSSKYSTIHSWDDPLTTLKPGQFFPTYGHQNAQYTSRIDFIVANHHFDPVNYVDATVGDTATADTGSDHYSTDFTYNFGGSSGGDTTAPIQVTGLTATAAGTDQINLSWNAASDDTGVDTYNIYRDGTLQTSVTTLSYSDTGLSSATTYSYTVSAVDAAGNEGMQSTSASATTDAIADTTAPSQVTGLTATTVSDSEIALSWNSASDNVAVDFYRVYRDGALYTTTPATSLNDIGLTPNTSYTYEVSAVDTSGNEGQLSTSVSATTDPLTAFPEMYVSSITIEKTNIHPKNGKFDILVQVTVLDQNGNPVIGADVTIDFQVPRGDIIQYTATTDANGIASYIITPPGYSPTGTFTVTVVDIVAAGYTYNPTLNIETSDSATLV